MRARHIDDCDGWVGFQSDTRFYFGWCVVAICVEVEELEGTIERMVGKYDGWVGCGRRRVYGSILIGSRRISGWNGTTGISVSERGGEGEAGKGKCFG